MTEPTRDKTICLIGRQCIQNQLLSRLLAERLGVNCVAALSPEVAWSILEKKHHGQTLFLCDCEGQDLATFLKRKSKIPQEIPNKSELGFFNVGTRRLKEPKVRNRRIKGVFRESVPIEGFVSGVSHMIKGDCRFPPEANAYDRVAEQSAERAPGDAERMLTPCEKRVLALIQEGKTNQQIAGTLGIKTKSVKNYIYRLFKKIEVSNRSQAALWANKEFRN